MALGRAVLGSSVGGIRELVKNEETGLLFDPEDVDDFCSQASRLIDDSSLRRKLARQGREMVLREKDWKKIAAQYSEIYAFAQQRHGLK
jgi:glycosyltransferase involved in cell wall biosynthesis